MTSAVVYNKASRLEFSMSGEVYIQNALALVKNRDYSTGAGEAVGSFDGVSQVTLTEWDAGASPVVTPIAGAISSPVAGQGSLAAVDGVVFRTASAPLVPGGFSIVGSMTDGTTFNLSANTDTGVINGSGVVGRVNYQTGVVELRFGTPAVAPGAGITDVSYLGISGVTYLTMKQAQSDTLRYNAVAYSYIPLDASILGLDPVRLPADGRVPVFRPGTVAVVHHAATTTPVTVSNGQTITLPRNRLSRVRVYGDNDLLITEGYTTNLTAGTVTFTDVTGYDQPVRIEHRIEDAALVSDAQISGLLRFTRPLTHDYPEGSYVSSALLLGDMFARVSKLYDQATWNNVWSDDLVGSEAAVSYDVINYPPVVENKSAVTERWALIFTGSTAFRIVGEHFGQIGTGTTSTDLMPLNPATGEPYFVLDKDGFGTGWAAGNVIRLNTVGAIAPVWAARVVLQGVAAELNDSFTLLVRGDVDTP